MTYWEAADILERGSLNYADIQEVYDLAYKLIKEKVRELDEAEDAKFREVPVKGPLYGTKSDVIFVDEFCGEVTK